MLKEVRQPLVSICIPNFNNGEFLGKAIESALKQTIQDIEVIVADNQSTDDSMQIAASFSDTRLRVYQNDVNIGMYENFQWAAEQATGTYLKFLAADDWLEPTYLESTLPCFGDLSVGLVSTRQAKYLEGIGVIGYRHEPVVGQIFYAGHTMLEHFLTDANPIGNPTRVIMRRSVFDELGGFDLNLEYCNDLDLWLRILERYNVCAVPDVHCTERKHEQQHTVQHAREATDIANICKAFSKSFDSMPNFWTQSRRITLCRKGMRNYARLGLRQASSGNRHYLDVTFKCFEQIAPRSSWYAYHLMHGIVYILQNGFKSRVRRLLFPHRRVAAEV